MLSSCAQVASLSCCWFTLVIGFLFGLMGIFIGILQLWMDAKARDKTGGLKKVLHKIVIVIGIGMLGFPLRAVAKTEAAWTIANIVVDVGSSMFVIALSFITQFTTETIRIMTHQSKLKWLSFIFYLNVALVPFALFLANLIGLIIDRHWPIIIFWITDMISLLSLPIIIWISLRRINLTIEENRLQLENMGVRAHHESDRKNSLQRFERLIYCLCFLCLADIVYVCYRIYDTLQVWNDPFLEKLINYPSPSFFGVVIVLSIWYSWIPLSHNEETPTKSRHESTTAQATPSHGSVPTNFELAPVHTTLSSSQQTNIEMKDEEYNVV